MKFPKHTFGPSCEGCNERLKQAHDDIAEVYYFLKSKYPDIHCSWVYRGKEDQEAAYKAKLSNCHFGKSKHNLLPAEAIDLFQQDENGKGIWDSVFCAKINQELVEAGFKLKWGGHFKRLGDSGHWERHS